MQTPAHIFREYDIRGVVSEDLKPETVTGIGRAFITFLRRKLNVESPSISLGRDVRPSSDDLSAALVEGMRKAGAAITDVGVVPTPVLYFAAHHLATDASVMITGSHNPPEYNGFKLGTRELPLSGAEIQSIYELIISDDFEVGEGRLVDRSVTDEYCDMVAAKVSLARPVGVVLDPANATGALFAADLLERVGAEVDCLYCEVDGTFPNHHPDPTVDAFIVDLKKRVASTEAELGIGLDGDCDRIGAIDENGRTIRGDQLTAIFAREQLVRTPGERILFDVKSSRALIEDIEAHGGIPVMWKTGHSLAKKKMHADGIPFGGEMSGHLFFFHDYFGFDDAIYAACKLCEIVSRSDRSLAEAVDILSDYPSTPEVRVDTTEEKKWEIVSAATRHFGDRYETIDIDGVRVQFPNGWALLRASNTQPVVVVRVEGDDESALEEIKDELSVFLSSQGVDSMNWAG